MVPAGLADVAPWPDWTAAAEAVLTFLHRHVGWDVWAITRVDGDRQVVVRTYPEDAVPPGTEVSWESSFCRQMLSGNAPRLATVTAVVPAYARRSREGWGRNVAAYMGVPLVTRDGEVYGTLCGIAFRAQPRSAARELPLLEILARLLSTLLGREQGTAPPARVG